MPVGSHRRVGIRKQFRALLLLSDFPYGRNLPEGTPRITLREVGLKKGHARARVLELHGKAYMISLSEYRDSVRLPAITDRLSAINALTKLTDLPTLRWFLRVEWGITKLDNVK